MLACNCKEKDFCCESCDHRDPHAKRKECDFPCPFHMGVQCLSVEEAKDENPCPF
jgi:hypothetical protein